MEMYWRVIVRFSLSRDTGSAVRNLIIARLKQVGLRNTKTGIWEGPHCEMVAATRMLMFVIRELSHVSTNWATGSPYLNHLWIYIDYRKRLRRP